MEFVATGSKVVVSAAIPLFVVALPSEVEPIMN
jgi:hypothetical protein